MYMLEELGADVNARGNAEKTPLMFASEIGHTELVKLLLSWQADPYATDHDNRDARYYASRNGHRQTQELLTAYVSSG